MTFVLKHDEEKLALFEDVFNAVTDPRSGSYGKYLTIDEITEMLAPAPEAVAVVVGLLREHNISHFSINRNQDMVKAFMPIRTAEKLFHTHFHYYTHQIRRAARVVRVNRPYYLPVSVARHVSFVGELVRFPALRILEPTHSFGEAADVTGQDAFDSCGTATCTSTTTPEVLSERYGFSVLTSSNSANSMAVAEFQFQGTDTTDLSNFATTCAVASDDISEEVGLGGEKIPGEVYSVVVCVSLSQ